MPQMESCFREDRLQHVYNSVTLAHSASPVISNVCFISVLYRQYKEELRYSDTVFQSGVCASACTILKLFMTKKI